MAVARSCPDFTLYPSYVPSCTGKEALELYLIRPATTSTNVPQPVFTATLFHRILHTNRRHMQRHSVHLHPLPPLAHCTLEDLRLCSLPCSQQSHRQVHFRERPHCTTCHAASGLRYKEIAKNAYICDICQPKERRKEETKDSVVRRMSVGNMDGTFSRRSIIRIRRIMTRWMTRLRYEMNDLLPSYIDRANVKPS